MKFAGCDLHKQSIAVCVVDASRKVLVRRTLSCSDEETIRRFFAELGPFRAVVEATAGYEWFLTLIEPHADQVLLAHPAKLRIIAESTRKSDKFDARVLAEFLALDMIPTSHRCTPRQRERRVLVRQRAGIQKRLTSVKNRMRRKLADYNSDRPRLFSREGLEHARTVKVSTADRFALDQMLAEYEFLSGQLKAAEEALRAFAANAPVRERERRDLLRSIPGVDSLTAEVVLAEIADVERFRAQKQAAAYAGLAPGQRESAGQRQELHLEKSGSKHLRWAVVEAAWRLVRYFDRWRGIYERLKARIKAKKAIVAIARRRLCLMTAILNSGRPYSATYQPAA